jgi:hypothetical protein
MPTITDSAKDLAYTAVGLNVLAYDELKARLAERGLDLSEQVAIARTHATANRARLVRQLDETGGQLQDRIRPVAEPVQAAIAPVQAMVAPVRRTVEETLVRFTPIRFRPAPSVAEPVAEPTPAAAAPAAATPRARKPRAAQPKAAAAAKPAAKRTGAATA